MIRGIRFQIAIAMERILIQLYRHLHGIEERMKVHRRDLLGGAAAFGAFAAAGPRAAAVMLSGGEGPSIIGAERRIQARYDHTLLDLAYENDLGYSEIVAANPGVDPWLPGEGTPVVLPQRHILPSAPREGVLVNLSEMRLYFFPPDGGPIRTHPVGIGREGLDTPTGTTRIVRKAKDPSWYPTQEARADNPDLPKVVGPGPENPLGTRALYFDWPTYLMHGTNNIWGIGRRISRGCIRMYPKDVEVLFDRVPVGTPVRVIEQPVKFAWHGEALYVQAHPSLSQVSQIEDKGTFAEDPELDISRLLGQALQGRISPIRWSTLERAIAERRGVPVRISV